MSLAKKIYKKADMDLVEELLEMYNPVTKYVFNHEVERKKSRFAESIIASNYKKGEIETPLKMSSRTERKKSHFTESTAVSNNRMEEIKTALNLWCRMVSQYAIEITDYATVKKYLADNVKYVRWITQKDRRRCQLCKSRHNKVYPIKKIPSKPHLNCRCYVVPVLS